MPSCSSFSALSQVTVGKGGKTVPSSAPCEQNTTSVESPIRDKNKQISKCKCK